MILKHGEGPLTIRSYSDFHPPGQLSLETPEDLSLLAASHKEHGFWFGDLACANEERTVLGLEFLGCRVGDIHGRAFGWQDGINQRQT